MTDRNVRQAVIRLLQIENFCRVRVEEFMVRLGTWLLARWPALRKLV